MSFLNDFGHPGFPEWEWEGQPPLPICEACGERHEPTDPCPIEGPPPADDEGMPLPEEPAWVEAGLPEEPGWGYQPLPGPPPVPSELDCPPIVPDEPIHYEKPAYRYSTVMHRSDN